MPSLIYQAPEETATDRLGAALADVLPDGTVVALQGTLGAGKTRLVQAIAQASGIDRATVVSPTFVLIQEHHGRRSLYHFDVYRLRDEDEFLALGPEEYFARAGLVLIEWADRVPSCLPRDYLEIRIEITGDQARQFEILAHGTRYQSALQHLADRLRRE